MISDSTSPLSTDPPPESARIEVVYRRPPGRTRRYRQELLLDDERLKITLQRRRRAARPREVGGVVTLAPGASVLWHTFPGRRYEVAAFYAPDGELLGHYTNIVRPPVLEGRRWEITDLFLDLWQPADGPPTVLDRGELEEARRRGWIDEREAGRAVEEMERIEARAGAGGWPPAPVGRWTLEDVPGLRLRRDEPGTYYANLVSNRIIAVGIYFLGAASVTSVAFAATTDALDPGGGARVWWLGALAVEAAALLGVGLAGRLPAARRVRSREVMTEGTLFLGAAVFGTAVLVVNESALWRSLLSAVYGALALFLSIFATCRLAFDRRLPRLALAGLAVCAVALVLLL